MKEAIFHPIGLGVAMFALAFFVSYAAYPLVLRMARVWKIIDNPDARKLQREPVPVFGGAGVFFAISVTCAILSTIVFQLKLLWMLAAMLILLIVGVADDKKKLSVTLRFCVEIMTVLGLILLTGNSISTFGGMFGVWSLPAGWAIPLSVIAGVGIINAFNLIDGVDGYSSSYAMMACICISVVYYISNAPYMAILSLICAGALLPFFLHNVFGKTTKMFIGDGGTLMIGTMLVIFCFSILDEDSSCLKLMTRANGIALAPVMLAILSVCIFDTLRVMTARLSKKQSPFHPDKTHLHHLFIDLGFSHIGTTLALLILNMLVVACWLISWLCGAGATVQIIVVVLTGLLNTAGLYIYMRRQEKNDSRVYRFMCSVGKKTHWQRNGFWKFMQKLVDGELFAEGRTYHPQTRK